MASVACPASPNSFRLRFGNRSKCSSSLFFNIRFRPATCRLRLISAGRGEGQSSTSGSPDPFAGWSGSESGVGADSKKKSDRFGGLLGAGLVGIFFTAGVTFASLSLSSRATPGGKQQMMPLTAEQEVLLTSDDQIVKVDQTSIVADTIISVEQQKIDDCNSGCQSGMNGDPIPRIETNQYSTGSGLDSIHDPEPSVMESAIPNGSIVDQIGQDTGGFLLPSISKPGSSEISPTGDADFFAIPSSTKVSHNTMLSGSPDQVIEYEENQSTADHVETFPLSTDSTAHVLDHQQGNLSHIDISVYLSSEFESQLRTKSITSNASLLDSDVVIGPQDYIKEVLDSEVLVSHEDGTVHSDKLQPPTAVSMVETVPSGKFSGSCLDQNEAHRLSKESINSIEGCILVENAPSVPYSANGDEFDTSSRNQIGRISKLEKELPEKPISFAGIPAPSLVYASLQVPPGKVLVPAVIDQAQGQAFSALQVLKIIEADVQPGDLCTRREYARWLVSASSAFSRNTISRVYPAMYIENVTELAFDDVTPEDPDYPCIQGLAEAGIISSKLSEFDLNGTSSGQQDSFFFSPGSPVSRQDLVSWKMAFGRRELPEVDKNFFYRCSGYIDIDKIEKDAWPALVADLSAGDQGITALAFGYTRLFQPEKPVTKGQAAIALVTGDASEVVVEELARIEAESLAESAGNAHPALVAQVGKELNASFEAELAQEREKIGIVEKLAEDTMLELEKLRAERAEEESALLRGRAAVESEMEILSRLRHEVEEQLQDLLSNKMEIAFEKDKINKLRKEAECDNQAIVQLQYELEVEREALSTARAWAEEEAKRARKQARALEAARDRWKRHGIKVVVDEDLKEDASIGPTWLTADQTVHRAENLVEKLKSMAAQMKNRSAAAIERTIQKIVSLISSLKYYTLKASHGAIEYASRSMKELDENASVFSSSVSELARRTAEDCKGGVEKLTQKFKT